VPTASIPDPGILGMTWYSQVLVLDGTPKPFPVSNLQSIMIVQ